MRLQLCSHKQEYESGIVWVPVYEFRQIRVCIYFNGGCSHAYEYGLPVNFTHTSSFCAGRVVIQPMQTKLHANSITKGRNLYSASLCVHTSNALFVTNQSCWSHSHKLAQRCASQAAPVSCTKVPTFR